MKMNMEKEQSKSESDRIYCWGSQYTVEVKEQI